VPQGANFLNDIFFLSFYSNLKEKRNSKSFFKNLSINSLNMIFKRPKKAVSFRLVEAKTISIDANGKI